MQHEFLPLTIEKERLYLLRDLIEPRKEELELFLKDNKCMNNKEFANNVLFSQEIKSNNNIEGYNDDVGLVYDILNNNLKISDKNKVQRIKNLYNGYKYIIKEDEINKDTLKYLYSLLSKNLLSKKELREMGEYYRINPVYIYYSSNISIEPHEGVDSLKIDKYMEEFFNYVTSNNNFECDTDYFIKSQIMHFQFINIHPYYDINGRTARTTSMWYLLNNKVYPYIIFNRAITLNKEKYYKVIRDVKKFHNITYFINYMLENVRVELEKEYVMNMIKSSSDKLSAVDYQTIYYILSMKGLLTIKDFINFYNNYNDKKKTIDIYNEMIEPLLDKGIILKERDTRNSFKDGSPNFIFKLNENKYEYDDKIKYLKLKK